MPLRKFPHVVAGGVFWATSEGVEQEEQGEHPWIILSPERSIEQTELVVAVPMTSNVMLYKTAEMYVSGLELAPRAGAKHPLDPEKMDGVVKCQKLRHWSVARVTEIVGDISKVGVEKLRGVVADLLDIRRKR